MVGAVGCLLKQSGQERLIVAGAWMGHLRENQLSGKIRDNDPFDPVAPREAFAAVSYAVDKEGANGGRSQPGAIDGDCGTWRRCGLGVGPGRGWHLLDGIG